MDWQIVKSAICEGRRFTVSDQGASVLADTMMPSGAIIKISIQSRFDQLLLHDGGAAFDEIARHGLEFSNVRSLRRMLGETHFGLTDEGHIFRDRITIENAAIGVALVADASYRAAAYMASHASQPASVPLDRKVQAALRLRYPEGRPNYKFEGKNRQHTFDFGVTIEGETVLVQAVSPDMSSVSAAVVKALDAKQAADARVRPILVFDRKANWTSSELNMLQLGGEGMELERLERELQPLAA